MTHRNGAFAAPRASQRDEPAENVPLHLVEELVAAAILAPSMHNTQPWRFRFEPGRQTIELYADPARMLPFGDPDGRAVHIACGAALLNLRLAAVAAGRQPLVRLIPAVTQRLLLATVRLAGPWPAASPVISSCTRPFRRAALTGRRSAAGRCQRESWPSWRRRPSGRAPCCTSRTIRRPSGCWSLARDTERKLLAEPAYRAELARWAGGARDREGIPDAALAPRDPTGAAPVRDFAAARPGPVRYAWFEERPQLAVLATPSGSRSDWLRAGQALQRVLLTATLRDVASSPLTQPLETQDAWLVRDPQSGFEYPQMILRFGYGLPVPHSPRRPVSEVLETIHTPGTD